MKFLLLIAVLIPSICFAQAKEQAGRWQLFQGEYKFVNIKGEVYWSRALFKLDTTTGKLYECKGWQYDGESYGKKGNIIQKHWCEPFDGELTIPMEKK